MSMDLARLAFMYDDLQWWAKAKWIYLTWHPVKDASSLYRVIIVMSLMKAMKWSKR
jgi:hypothetical protein